MARVESDDSVTRNSLKPSFNFTEAESIAWFQIKLPDFDVFKSDNLTGQFHERVLEFFGHECEVQAFMTWISPANFFGKRALPNGCLMILSTTLDTSRTHLLERQKAEDAITEVNDLKQFDETSSCNRGLWPPRSTGSGFSCKDSIEKVRIMDSFLASLGCSIRKAQVSNKILDFC